MSKVKARCRIVPNQEQRKILIADISMWLDFEKRDLEDMKNLTPLGERYRSKWLSAGGFHGMAHALYIFGLRAGLLLVEDFSEVFFGKAA